MKSTWLNCGLGGIALAGVLVACVSSLTGTNETHGATSPDWHRVDKSELFLHDLTSGPATLVAAMKVSADGSITGDLMPLHELQYMHSPEGLVAARSSGAVALGAQADGEVFFNASADPVMAYFEVAHGLAEVALRPGEGVAVGKLSSFVNTQTQRGCKCICSGTHPNGNPLQMPQFIPCHQVETDHEPGTACDCSSLNGSFCWFPDNHAEFDPTYRDCKGGFIPVNPGNGS